MSQGSRKSQEDGLKGMLSAMGVVVFIAFMKFTPVVLFGMLIGLLVYSGARNSEGCHRGGQRDRETEDAAYADSHVDRIG